VLKVKPSNSKKKKAEIVAVGTENHGYLYLQRLGYVKAGESLQVKKYSATKKQVTGVINAVIKGIAKDKGIEKEEAAEYIFGKKVDGTIAYPSDRDAVLLEYEEELGELNKNEVPTLEIWNFVANLMLSGFYVEGEFIPGRVAFQVELLEDVSLNVEKIKIEGLGFPLPAKTKIKFGDVILTVKENHEEEVQEVVIEKSPGSIKEGEIGFLYDDFKRQYVLGNEDWTFADTASLPQELIQAIFEFYQSETLNLMEESEGIDEKKALTPLEEVKKMDMEVEANKTLTGTQSTSKSKSTESKTVDLVAG
jgi:hypothetical protein